MPKETFFNLPEEKRTMVFEAAVGEFAAHPFAQASINRIVARCGIAKGSFYQYFEDKSDLFLYVVQMVADEKLNFLASAVPDPEQYDFFTLLCELSRAGIQFALARPQYAEISERMLASRGTAIYKKVIQHSLPAGLEFFETLLEKAIARGEVRADIDIRMQAYMITSMYALVIEYYLEHVGHEYDETMMQTIDQFLDSLRYGIAATNSAELRVAEPASQRSQSKGVP